MNRSIRKVAVLGSGIMGSRIACHFANIGVEVLLLDMVPRELSEAEKAKGITTEHPAFRNRLVNDSFQQTLKPRRLRYTVRRLPRGSSWVTLMITWPTLKITTG
jgi:3-hydroxyacyl-CoA dehydrogenase